MGFPVNVGVVRWVWERCGIERVDVCSHSIIFLSGKQSFFLGQFAGSFILIGLFFVDFLSLHKRNIIVEMTGYKWQINNALSSFYYFNAN